jgi:tRNA pseudouridine55 synthase
LEQAERMHKLEEFRSPEGGVILVDKPLDWTSFDVVKKVRGLLRVKKVGHAGTLDPLATGLLILCSGKMTKSIDSYQILSKVYEGSIKLGGWTESYDAATEVQDEKSIEGIGLKEIVSAIEEFTGTIQQLPPMYSAVRVQGTRLYSLARKGKTVEREARTVTVHAFDIVSVELPEVRFRIECSKGTYIRSIAHDLGQKLGCGAYLSSLRRSKIGQHDVADAWQISELEETRESMPGTSVSEVVAK